MTYHAQTPVRGLGDQGEDMEAIDWYFYDTEAKTSAARDLKDDWIVWYDGLDWWDRNYDQSTYDEARERRDAFNLANATTAAEREQVEQVIETGMTTEEMQGGTSRKTSGGTYGAEEPLLSTKTKIIIGAVILGGAYIHFAFLRPFSQASKRVAERIA